MRSDCTVVVAGAPTPMLNIGQVKLSHRYVFVLLDSVTFTGPDVFNLVFRITIYNRRIQPLSIKLDTSDLIADRA